MKAVIFAYSRTGRGTALRIREILADPDLCLYVPERLADGGARAFPSDTETLYRTSFAKNDALIFVGACGIAVRKTAPYIRDKATDPAVICVDEKGRFVIPLLSGHIGGANALAVGIAKGLQARAVITTATDINGRFSADQWAAENGFVLDSLSMAKRIAAEILERDVPVISDFPVSGECPDGIYFIRGEAQGAENTGSGNAGTDGSGNGEIHGAENTGSGNAGAGSSGNGEAGTKKTGQREDGTDENKKTGIYIGYRNIRPFAHTLRIIPKVIHLGIGCRKGVSKEAVAHAVSTVLEQNAIDPRAVADAASADLKRNEKGLVDYCAEHQIPLSFYSSGSLMRLEGRFSASEFVLKITGADNICERAAVMSGGRLIIRKTAVEGVTVAAASGELKLRF